MTVRGKYKQEQKLDGVVYCLMSIKQLQAYIPGLHAGDGLEYCDVLNWFVELEVNRTSSVRIEVETAP